MGNKLEVLLHRWHFKRAVLVARQMISLLTIVPFPSFSSILEHVRRKVFSKRYILKTFIFNFVYWLEMFYRQDSRATCWIELGQARSQAPAQEDCDEEDSCQYDNGKRHVASLSWYSQRYERPYSWNQENGVPVPYQLCEKQAWHGYDGNDHLHKGIVDTAT